jgi:TPP-dependent pyruvate/acetoin dehydrogenase alpha subunit
LKNRGFGSYGMNSYVVEGHDVVAIYQLIKLVAEDIGNKDKLFLLKLKLIKRVINYCWKYDKSFKL